MLDAVNMDFLKLKIKKIKAKSERRYCYAILLCDIVYQRTAFQTMTFFIVHWK